jgi:hypothetical protein
MNRWRLQADRLVVWVFYLMIQAAVTMIRLIRGRNRDGAGTG